MQNKKGIAGELNRKAEASHPPSVTQTLGSSQTFTFYGVSAGTFTLTGAMLLNLYQVATSATTTARIFGAVKLNRVRIWGPSSTSFQGSVVSVEWLGSNAPSKLVSDKGMYPNPSYINTRPPKESSARWWVIGGSNESTALCKIAVPQEAVVYVDVSYRLMDDDSATSGDSTTGMTLGKCYYNYLDGRASGKVSPTNSGVNILP